mmetsp:Transcript_8737/g.15339  ORF Transcript_8737/g.15339 Transcript_8737/m.15339 type:complete len:194 (-) Transcript_8737:131-712(-)|eukprot:CAMPEP_0184523426 /NCGR_PEP_ID=MMETSP0198_2-20121128/8875_1 /TAXON_ID=1112570 /ORGANISM="Thraustochytrium sp., Strain LLF1b" /LENGTH=193 /DNA_ID=CAMNT_0026914451 /DNA_START=215 /DNA_END=796 /DNA_ORIENTATION=+
MSTSGDAPRVEYGMGFKYYGPLRARGDEEGRPPVANSVLLLPRYARDELIELLYNLLNRENDWLRTVCDAARMEKSLTVVSFIEQLAVSVQDLEQEHAIIRGNDAVLFWLEIQDKLQQIALKRLKPRQRRSALLYNDLDGPVSYQEEDISTQDQATNGSSEGNTENASNSLQGSNGLPVLRLEIPSPQPLPHR